MRSVRAANAWPALLFLAALSLGCASHTGPTSDPLEPLNRGLFWFNEQVDGYVLEPVARGWDWITPDPVQRSISRFFTNLRFPVVFVNDLLQGKPGAAGTDVVRFVMNSLWGIGGLFDPATEIGLAQSDEDFGQTLGVWGVGPGPYLVLPILGPSNARDLVAGAADSAASVVPFFLDRWILAGARALQGVNQRAMLLDEIEQARRDSFDFYLFVRDAYLARRRAAIRDGALPTGPETDDLYYPEDDLDAP